jgi:PAS domain S-box-containing protein
MAVILAIDSAYSKLKGLIPLRYSLQKHSYVNVSMLIQALEDINPDIIFIDSNTVECCNVLKNSFYKGFIPLIFITRNDTDKSIRGNALEAGVDAFLSEPFDEIDLRAVLNLFPVKKNGTTGNVSSIDFFRNERVLLRTLIDNLPDAVYIKDRKGRKLAANEADLKIMNFHSESEVIGKTDLELFETEYEQQGYYQDMEIMSAGKALLNYEDNYIDNNGIKRWRLISKIPIFDNDNKVMGLVGFGRDITERKYHENVQNILFEIEKKSINSKDVEELLFVVRDELGTLMDTSNFFVAIYDKESDCFRKLFFLNQKENVEEWDASKSMSGQVLKHKKSILLIDSQIDKYVADYKLELIGVPAKCWLGVPLMDGENVFGVMVVQSYTNPNAYDVTSMRLLELIAHELSIVIQRTQMIKDLISAKEKAEESDRLKSAFLANVSHEIRTPMNGILGFIELLGEEELTVEQKAKYLNIVNKSGQRLLGTINDIIEISRIESGQIDYNPSKVNTVELMLYYYDFFKQQAEAKNLDFVLNDYVNNEHSTILTDKYKLEGLLTNLISNAIKYTCAGSVCFGNYIEDNDLVFYVKDTGLGIPASRVESVFERFIQTDLNVTKPQEGSGLGLAIVKAYVDIMSGKIWVDSEEGKGSTFYFTIPLK